jgi:hypothetical protein
MPWPISSNDMHRRIRNKAWIELSTGSKRFSARAMRASPVDYSQRTLSPNPIVVKFGRASARGGPICVGQRYIMRAFDR